MTPMPTIETGDWVCGYDGRPWIVVVVPLSFPPHTIVEIRKANGVVWVRKD